MSATGTWNPGLLAEVPVNWRLTSPEVHERHGVYWANSIMNYLKSQDILKIGDGIPRAQTGVPQPGRVPFSVGVTYNGMLHTLNMTQVVQPSTVPMFWYGIGRVNYTGQVISTPGLRCAGTGACQFNPNGYPDETNGGGNQFATVWFSPPAETTTHRVYGTGSIFVRTDTSAKFRRIGVDGGGVVQDFLSDPFREYNAAVRGISYTGCRPTGSTGPFQWCFFRPDLEL